MSTGMLLRRRGRTAVAHRWRCGVSGCIVPTYLLLRIGCLCSDLSISFQVTHNRARLVACRRVRQEM